MKINIILPSVKISGGIRTIFQYANYLTDNGHEVYCYYPKSAFHTGKLKCLKDIYRILFMKPESKGEWFDARFKLLNPPVINNITVYDADIVIATAWSTAYNVQRLSEKKGKKVYFIQGFETWGTDQINKMVIETYYFKWDKAISVSTALHDRLQNETGLKTTVICNGIPRTEIRKAPPNYSSHKLIVGFPYREDKIKNCKLAIELLEELQVEKPDLKIYSYGPKKPEEWPLKFDFLENPNREQLYDFYENVDVFYVPSIYEGWGLPAVEAMGHCCAVLAANNGAIAEFGIDDINCIKLKDPADKDKTKTQIIDLINDENKIKTIGLAAWQIVKDNYTFETQARLFEEELLKLI